MREISKRYSGRGLQVVGVHSPEFERERDVAIVRRAITRLEIPYPVAIDNDYRIWDSFANRYWPALYLLNRDGRVVWSHVGELHRDTGEWRKLTSMLEVASSPGTSLVSP